MRALVIEDDPGLTRLLRRGLGEAGFSVDSSRDGEDGLHLASSGTYDVIVLDLMLPVLSGREVLAGLRTRGRRTPVLVLTARDSLADKLTHLDLGADDYLTKPFAMTEIVARLRAMVRRAHRLTSALMRVADLEMDTTARRVRRGDRRIDLSWRQYALLELLMLKRDTVVRRDVIYDKIYDGNSDTMSNVVDVHVCRLRESVDRSFGRRLIHTVRGEGYMLSDRGELE